MFVPTQKSIEENQKHSQPQQSEGLRLVSGQLFLFPFRLSAHRGGGDICTNLTLGLRKLFVLRKCSFFFHFKAQSTRHLFMATLHVCAVTAQSCLTLCGPVDCSPRGSSVHGILQARVLEWVAMASSRGSSQPRDRTCISWISCTDGRVLTTSLSCMGRSFPVSTCPVSGRWRAP